jgi:hypothetical protein
VERTYSPPSDEQLVNFVCVQVFGYGATDSEKAIARTAVSQASARAEWLRRHRELQEAIWEAADG